MQSNQLQAKQPTATKRSTKNMPYHGARQAQAQAQAQAGEGAQGKGRQNPPQNAKAKNSEEGTMATTQARQDEEKEKGEVNKTSYARRV